MRCPDSRIHHPAERFQEPEKVSDRPYVGKQCFIDSSQPNSLSQLAMISIPIKLSIPSSLANENRNQPSSALSDPGDPRDDLLDVAPEEFRVPFLLYVTHGPSSLEGVELPRNLVLRQDLPKRLTSAASSFR